MKDKEKQIEEMAKIIDDRIINRTWRAEKVAKELYEIAVPKDSVVLSREEYSDYLILQKNHEFIREKAKELQADNERLYKNIGKFKEIVSKETAEKIYRMADEICTGSQNDGCNILAMIKQQFGVEIKE